MGFSFRLQRRWEWRRSNATQRHRNRYREHKTGQDPTDAFRGMYKLAELRRQTEFEWARMDVLVVPTTGTIYTLAEVEHSPIDLNRNLGRYTNFVNLLDLCAIAVPAGFRPNGLPFGVTLIGPAFQDAMLCALGSAYQRGASE